MYLKSIEIQGFKSFANRIVLQFHNGITGIVGPNGSGKSNVADAVRWVLGEQRVKQLRGGSMQDVIFAGTQSRKPQGFAYVAITLDNSDHALPVSFDEVTVSRRLYRSGESEYMINGSACRLKDVNELFYDTGIGKEGYSIIGQGQIEAILSGKPEERRALFDEAAGIVKFKRRKLEAQKKLDDEQQNLIRVNDILSELSRQIGPLERQSEKAKIYLKKRDELKTYEVNTFLFEFQELKDRFEEAKKNSVTAQAQLKEVEEEAGRIRGQYDKLQEELEQLEVQQAQLRDEITTARLEKQNKENQIQLLEEQMRSAEDRDLQQKNRLTAIDEDLANRSEDRKKIEDGIEALQKDTEQRRLDAEAMREEHDGLHRQIVELTGSIEKDNTALMEILNSRSTIQAAIERCDTMLEQVRIRKAELDSQVLMLRSQQNDQSFALEDLKERKGKIEEQIKQLTERSGQVNAALQKCQEKLTAANAQFETEQVEYHRESSRLESLRNIAERYDGYGNSIRRVMEQRNHVAGLLGVVADLIKTDKKYETAIETALGGSIQNIVTADEDTAKRMINYLKQNRFGRATFLPLTAMKHSSQFRTEQALSEPGVIGLASSLVQAEARFDGLVQNLLGRTVVVDDIDHAVALARKYRYSLRIVTLEGELLNAGGSMTGGAFKGSSNLLGRRREIEELTTSVRTRSNGLEKLRQIIDECRKERGDLRIELTQISQDLQRCYLDQNTAKLRLQEMEGRADETESGYQKIREENELIKKQIAELTASRDEEAKKMEGSSDEEQRLRAQTSGGNTELLTLRNKQNEASGQLEQIHLEIAAGEQKIQYLQGDKGRLTEEITSLRLEKQQIQRMLEATGGSDREREEKINSLREEISQLEATREAAEKRSAELSSLREEKTAEQKEMFAQRDRLSEQSSLLDRECVRLSNQIERLDERRENRIAYMWDEYELTYSSALPLKREDLGNRADWKKIIGTLRGEIRQLGSVNVGAIDEFKEVSERYTFLSGQHDDLIRAEKALEKIIAELDEGMRKQFREQFEKIQVEFDKSFKDLFGGGKGTLELMEDGDVLEAGIRIIAQPPGKKLQNMMQMSGGEKALTAIALLFAIQNLKPSPFCLLDEIEAALDENNVDRYAQYLHKLTKYTQFIIITHRRGTMAAADRLYGITMQEKGVSALVSVNLIESELDS